MILIDANVFLAHDNTKDVHHKQAVRLWQEIETGVHGAAFTTDYVLNEVAGVTFRKRGKEHTVKIGKQILTTMAILNIDERLLHEAWKLFTETKTGLNLVDCTNIVALRITNTNSIAMFDEGFKKVAKVVS